ncbi:MAG: DNA sulfur modification protein DndB [Thaumarchaeota archaeon S15]|nr:MAG: DNA sulfur modification protein DndB [Thaumarchaeota archaeon S15]
MAAKYTSSAKTAEGGGHAISEANVHSFEAIRGTQGKRTFYLAVCTMKAAAKIFTFVDASIPADARAQRTLRKSRIPRIRDYIIGNPDDYIFSSITVSVDGKISFRAVSEDMPNMGMASFPQDASVLINDGQHRVAAIKDTLEQMSDFAHDKISVVFFEDVGLKTSQQMFSDLNKNAVKPTKSLNILYDRRNKFSKFVVDLTGQVEVFKGRTEMEKTTISNRSTKFFTLNGIAEATKAFLGKTSRISDEERGLAAEFWTEVAKNIPEWRQLVERRVVPVAIRNEYVHANVNMLVTLGIVGRKLVEEYPTAWRRMLGGLGRIDWQRSNPDWEGKVVINGKMIKHKEGISRAVELILGHCMGGT